MNQQVNEERNIPEWAIRQRFSMSLDAKVAWAHNRIRQWHDHWAGKVYVAFSGGQDSQVLLHLVRSLYPHTPAVFYREPTYPEVLRVVKETPNVITLIPKMTLPECIARFGYPVISKETSRYVYESRSAGVDSATWRLYTTGFTSSGKYSKRSRFRLSQCWHKLLTAPFAVSDKCCNVNKKNPAKAYQKKTGEMPFVGTLACESNQRMLAYRRFGCNGYSLSSPRSLPMAIWQSTDVDTYRQANNIKRAEVYEMGYTRTGCMICGFGCHLRHPNQFELLHDTHPPVWRWAMDKMGWRRVLDWLQIQSGELPLFHLNGDAEH